MSKSVPIIERLGHWLLIVFLGLIPLFFLPFTQDFYDTNKWLLLVLGSLVMLSLWTLRGLATGSFPLNLTPAGLAFGSLTLAAAASLLVASANKVEALLTPLGVSTFASLSLIFLLGTTFFDKDGKAQLKWGFLGSAGLVGLVAFYQFLGLGKAFFPAKSFLSDPLWTPVGSSLGAGLILILTLPLALATLATEIRAKREVGSGFAVLITGLILGDLILTLSQLWPRLSTTLLPLATGWAILLEVFKNPLQALFGVGSENFLAAFTQGRPVSLNAGPFWNVRFVISSSLALQIATTLGLVGAVGLVVLLRSLLLNVFSRIQETPGLGLRASLIAAALVILLAPPSLSVLVTVAVILLVSEKIKVGRRPQVSAWVKVAVGLVAFVGLSTLFYAIFRAWTAETAYYQSTLLRQKGKGTETYNFQILASQRNPWVSRFHVGLSQTSLALANAIVTNAASAASLAGQLTNQDQQTVNQLVQQAIREAKVGVSLAPKSIVAWENLATIYEAIIRVAQGGDQWAISAWQRAIQLDPTNPILRLRLAGVLVSLNRLDEAKNLFQSAVSLKPNYANAHYNLASIYRQKQQFLQAALELAATKALVLPGSDDEKKVIAELSEIKQQLKPQERDFLDKQIAGSGAGSATGIVSPIAAPELQLSPRLNLPPEASPPATR